MINFSNYISLIQRIKIEITLLIPFCLLSLNTLAASPDGTDLYLEGKYNSAIQLWQIDAEKEDPRSVFLLGMMHLEGSGVPLDRSRAFHYLQRSALNDYSLAFPLLGRLYETGGADVPWKPKQAEHWYSKATVALEKIRALAESGDVFAQRVLGWMLAKGNGAGKDPVRAEAWLYGASEKGDLVAGLHLAELHEREKRREKAEQVLKEMLDMNI